MWRRWQAVAAVALLVVVSSLTVWFWQSPSANYLEKQSAELNVMHEPDELVPGSITPEQPMALVVPAARSGKKQHVKVGGVAKAEALAAEQEVLLNKEVEEIQIEENYIEEQKRGICYSGTKTAETGRQIFLFGCQNELRLRGSS